VSTFVLVHGAWHGGWCWDRVAGPLRAAGHAVLAPTLTGLSERAHLLTPMVGLDTHVEDVVRLLDTLDLRDVVLVGHSYAGMVVSGVANAVPDRIARLVYLDAMVPVHGESAVDVMPVVAGAVAAALSAPGGWRVPPPPEQPAPWGLFGVTDPADVAWVRTMLSDQPVGCLREPVALDAPAAARIPRTHVHCTVQPAGLVRRPAPAGAHVVEIPTGHDCMVTRPDAVVDVLAALR
jgi:pimeloyl-ACP methyl ester carboxylesterase